MTKIISAKIWSPFIQNLKKHFMNSMTHCIYHIKIRFQKTLNDLSSDVGVLVNIEDATFN